METQLNTMAQQEVVARGKQIFDLMGTEQGSIFNKDWWYGRIMDWSMQNEKFKIQMFRFVDVLPYLNSSDEVARHLKEYFTGEGQEMPSILGWGLGLGSLVPGIMASSIKKNVTQMARMFITGANPKEAIETIKKLRESDIAFTADILGEAALSEIEAQDYQKKYLELIETLANHSGQWPERPLIDRDHNGPIPKVNVSVKVSSLYSQFDPMDQNKTVEICKDRLRPIFRRAKELGVFLNLDMESYFHKDTTLTIFKSLISEPEFSQYHEFGIVIQAYLKDSERDLRDLIQFAAKRNGRITVRLVKGAYWDYETVLAQQRGWPIPVFTNKAQTDDNYEKLSTILLENDRYIRTAFGSHNIRSVSHALVQAEKLGVDIRSFEIQMLYGMGESIKRAMVKMGLRVREYAPIGELIPGMAYLVRRLLENTSNESFLRAKEVAHKSPEQLLVSPASIIPKQTGVSLAKPYFENEPFLDFNEPGNRKKMEEALAKVRKNLGQYYPLVIGKKEIKTPREQISYNPTNPKEVVGKTAVAGASEADLALEVCHAAQKDWAKQSWQSRAQVFEKAAEIMQRRKFELCAISVLEVGKTWREADGEIAEAIDFCKYYAREALRISKPQNVSGVPGEDSFYIYQPRGVGVIIAPWNFPLAILCGMTVAAAITGNAVIMKPAEQSPIIAGEFMKVLKEAGLPAGVVNFLPGLGEEVGQYLVDHHKTDFITFTGSKEVGLQIIKSAAVTRPGQKNVKKVIAEMGGKNAIIVDSDADMDEAVLGVLYSAFGFQGQKCSACSRLIVLEENYDKFISRLMEAARSLTVGNPEDPGTKIGPVVDANSQERILTMIEKGQSQGTLLYKGQVPTIGYFVPPTLIADVKPNDTIAQQEIFGPVLAIIKVKNFDEALDVANSTEFALTGGLYSRSPAHIERAKTEFNVGNLYINRGITGALVGRHPFGGFKMSGVGSKAGGPDYLLQFVEPRTVTENTMRRGFAPTAEEAKPLS